MNNYSIALLCSTCSDNYIIKLAEKMPIWVASDSISSDLIIRVRKEVTNSHLTVINRKKGESNIDFFMRSLYDIDEHHGNCSLYSPYKNIIVEGYIDNIPISILHELGFEFIALSNGGFELNK